MSETQDEEILKKMQEIIRKKGKKNIDEDSVIMLDDGTELKVRYDED